jgi:hypothetical protein
VSSCTCDSLLLDVSRSAESTGGESFILLRFDLIHESLGLSVNCSPNTRPVCSHTLDTARSSLLHIALTSLVLDGEMLLVRDQILLIFTVENSFRAVGIIYNGLLGTIGLILVHSILLRVGLVGGRGRLHALKLGRLLVLYL